MYHLYSSQDLNSMLITYCQIHNDSLDNILYKISKFSVVPSWTESKFVSRDVAENYALTYIRDRESVLLKEDNSKAMLPIINKFYAALSHEHPKIYEFCNALIRLILVAGLASYREGTTSEGLGIAHIDFKSHFNQQDFNELIVHQITHLLLYYNDAISTQVPNEIKSTIITTKFEHKRGGHGFPLYILFHSFCVAIDVLQFRIDSDTVDSLVNYHSTTDTVIKRCIDCVDMLTRHDDYFTPQGKVILLKYINTFEKQKNLIC